MNKKISLILVIIWMIVIFIMSSFNADASSNQSNFIVDIISNLFNINNIELLSIIVRKLAHFTDYLILGILLGNCFINYHKNMYYSIIVFMIYAISDEVHQIFVPGRSFQVRDIIIDILGGLIGLIIINKCKQRFDK